MVFGQVFGQVLGNLQFSSKLFGFLTKTVKKSKKTEFDDILNCGLNFFYYKNENIKKIKNFNYIFYY